MALKEKRDLLEKLKEKMREDKSLPLREGVTNLVFGEGNPDTGVLFIGEGPGFWEDKEGKPFVGNAGALLNQLLYSIKLARREVFITNVIHYRPPSNRDPLPEEIEAFRPYLDEIIEIIDPMVIVTLGRFSMGKFLPGVYISSIHGKQSIVNWKQREIIIIPMYHPAAGLRRQDIKYALFEDFKKVPEAMKKIEEEKVKNQNKAEQMQLV